MNEIEEREKKLWLRVSHRSHRTITVILMALNETLAGRQMTAHTHRTDPEVQGLNRLFLTDSPMIVFYVTMSTLSSRPIWVNLFLKAIRGKA